MLTKKGAPINSRQQKGLTIAQLHDMVRRIGSSSYKVKSQSGNGIYYVLATESGWKCSCPDYAYRNEKCKHVFANEFSLTLRKTVEVKRIEQITSTANCIFCNSNRIVKDGIRHNKYGDIQKFNCKACGHYFTINLGFERMRAKPEIITSAMQLYFTGDHWGMF